MTSRFRSGIGPPLIPDWVGWALLVLAAAAVFVVVR